jgi:hypothetical protein
VTGLSTIVEVFGSDACLLSPNDAASVGNVGVVVLVLVDSIFFYSSGML